MRTPWTLLAALVLALAVDASTIPATGHHWIVRVPPRPCDGFDCSAYSGSADGRGSCAVTVSAMLDFATSAGAVDTVSHIIEARKDPNVAGYCTDVTAVQVTGNGAGTRVTGFTATKQVGDDGATLLGYVVAAQLAAATDNPSINVTYQCEGALQHYNVYLDAKISGHMYALMLTLLSQPSLSNPKADVVLPGALKAEQVTFLPATPLVRYDSAANETVFTVDAMGVPHFALAATFALDAVYIRCSGATWWYPESTVVRYAVYGGILVGGLCLLAATCWYIVKKCIKRKVNNRLYTADLDVLEMDDDPAFNN